MIPTLATERLALHAHRRADCQATAACCAPSAARQDANDVLYRRAVPGARA